MSLGKSYGKNWKQSSLQHGRDDIHLPEESRYSRAVSAPASNSNAGLIQHVLLPSQAAPLQQQSARKQSREPKYVFKLPSFNEFRKGCRYIKVGLRLTLGLQKIAPTIGDLSEFQHPPLGSTESLDALQRWSEANWSPEKSQRTDVVVSPTPLEDGQQSLKPVRRRNVTPLPEEDEDFDQKIPLPVPQHVIPGMRHTSFSSMKGPESLAPSAFDVEAEMINLSTFFEEPMAVEEQESPKWGKPVRADSRVDSEETSWLEEKAKDPKRWVDVAQEAQEAQQADENEKAVKRLTLHVFEGEDGLQVFGRGRLIVLEH